MDHFTDVTLSVFFLFKQKQARRVMPNLVNMWSFMGIRWKLVKIWDLKVAKNFYEEMYVRGQRTSLQTSHVY